MELETDLFSFNTGRVLAKVGMNDKTDEPSQLPVNFVVVDNKPHLTEKGIAYLAQKSKNLIIATTNKIHPASTLKKKIKNIYVLTYEKSVNLQDLFWKISKQFGAERMTIQSGGTLNTTLVREGLIDRILLVIAPALIGGKNTSTLMDGESLHSSTQLNKIKILKLVQAKPLEDSYLLLEYTVKN